MSTVWFTVPKPAFKTPALRRHQVHLHISINSAHFDWAELGNNYWSRSAGKSEKTVWFYQLDRAKQLGLGQNLGPLALVCWSLAQSASLPHTLLHVARCKERSSIWELRQRTAKSHVWESHPKNVPQKIVILLGEHSPKFVIICCRN